MKTTIHNLIDWFSQPWNTFEEAYIADRKLLKKWSKMRKFKYSSRPVPEGTLPPLIELGTHQLVEHSVKGVVSKCSFVLFKYTSVEVTKYGDEINKKWIVKFEVSNELPGFVVDGKDRSKLLTKSFTDYSKLSLEGKFNDRFTVYIPSGDQIPVLSVLSPDVLWDLYDKHSGVDIIVAGKNIWIIVEDQVDVTNLLDSILAATEHLVKELNHRAKTYKHKTDSTELLQ